MTIQELKEVETNTKVIDMLTGEELEFIAYDENVLHAGARCSNEKGITYWVRPEDLRLKVKGE